MDNIAHKLTEDEYLKQNLSERPEPPHPAECCGRGCERCVYVYYAEALGRWEERVTALKEEYKKRCAGGRGDMHE